MKVRVKLEIEFETDNDAAARPAVTRLPGDIRIALEHGAIGMTHVVRGSSKVTIIEQEFA